MKKLTLLILICMLGTANAVYAQLDQYVEETRGDTLVIKSIADMQGTPNSLLNAINEDTDAPESRVYELKRGGWYPFTDEAPSTPEDRPLRIVGQASGPMVQGEDEQFPAIISGYDDGEITRNGNMLSVQNDITFKNLNIVLGDNEGGTGFQWFTTQDSAATITFDNVIAEHTNWVYIDANDAPDANIHIKDSYFVNLIGETCRRNGGVYDNVNNNTGSIIVENSTHVMGAGTQYKMRGYPVDEVKFNHNTFVNVSGQLFGSFGYQSNMIVSNNLFVNANVQAYITGLDVNEFDQDFMPHGIINIDTLRSNGELNISEDWITSRHPDIAVEDFGPDDRHVLVTHNGLYWDDRVSNDIAETLNNDEVPCPAGEEGTNCIDDDAEWVSQAFTMNERTQAMFDDDENYPYLTEGEWIEAGAPDFTDDGGLLSDEVIQDLIDWSVTAAGESPGALLVHWRDNSLEDQFVYSDWPVKANLSYGTTAYRYGAVGNLPLGDLNWFPEEKAVWLENKDELDAELQAALEEGREPTYSALVSNEKVGSSIPSAIKLDQNYPNPFNPTTQISFTLPQAQEVSLKVYDMLGREVATIVNNERFSQGVNSVTFDAASLASGMYIYRLTSANLTLSKKMTLIK